MTNTLGNLIIELGINQAAFHSGLDKATYAAKKFAQETKRELQGIGGALSELGNAFTGLGGPVGAATRLMQDSFGAISTLVKGASGGMISTLGGVALGVGGVGLAFGGAALVAKEWAESAEETVHGLEMISQKTGISIENLEGLKAAGSTVDVSLESLTVGMRHFEKSLADLAEGKAGAGAAVLRGLKVSATDPMAALLQTADALSKVKDQSILAADARMLFGRSGLDLLPLLKEGSKGLQEYLDMAQKYGPVIGTEDVEATDKFKKANAEMGLVWDDLKEKGIVFLPILTAIKEALADAANHALHFGDFGPKGPTADDIKKGMHGADLSGMPKISVDTRTPEQMRTADLEKYFQTLQAGSKAGYDLEQARLALAGDITAEEWKDAANQQEIINKLEPIVRLEKERKDFLNTLSQQTRKTEDKSNLDAQQALAAMRHGVGEADVFAAAAADVAAKRQEDLNKATELGIQNDKRYQAALAERTATWEKNAGVEAISKAHAEDFKSLEEFTHTTEESAHTMLEEASAGNSVGAAMDRNNAKLAPYIDKLAALNAEYTQLASSGKASTTALAALRANIDLITSQMQAAALAVGDLNTAISAPKIPEITKEMALLATETQTALSGRDTEKFAIQIQEFGARTNATKEQIADYATALRAKTEAEQVAQVMQSHGNGLGEMSRLQGDRQTLINNQSIIVANSSLQQYKQTLAEVDAQMADLTAKSATGWSAIGAGLNAAVKDMIADVPALGDSIRKLANQDMQELNNSIAQFIVTGKGGFTKVVESMVESLIKLGLQYVETTILKHFFDSQSTAAQVGGFSQSQVVRQAAIGQSAAEAAASAAWAGPEAAVVAAAETIALLEGITALAAGGDVQAGHAYLVGEKHPEIFVAGTSGHVYPQNPADVVGGGRSHGPLANVTMNANIQAIDRDGMAGLLQEHGRMIADEVMAQVRMTNGL